MAYRFDLARFDLLALELGLEGQIAADPARQGEAAGLGTAE